MNTTPNPAHNAASSFELLPLDVCSEASVQTCVQTILGRTGRIDLLVNNAGFARCPPLPSTTQITIEHIVVASDRSYEQVIEALEAQLGLRADWDNIARALLTAHASWEQAVQIVEQQLGTSGFTILSKIEPGALLTLSGKPTRATQYAIGNPLLAIQMIEHAPEACMSI